MAWWGKIAGGAFGFMLGGPLGAMLGVTFGHQFDKGLNIQLNDTERTQAAFFTATFAVMGCVAKADGRVSQTEIKHARAVMRQMRLNNEQTAAAIELFYIGKGSDFDLDAALAQFKFECHRKLNLIRMFLEIQITTATADGDLSAANRALLQRISDTLGFPKMQFAYLLQAAVGASNFGGYSYSRSGGRSRSNDRDHRAKPPKDELSAAYKLLGVSPGSSDAELRRAYRRLMSQHHPDKLVSKGLPEEMIRLATAKTQQISKAYDLLKDSRAT